MPVKRNPKKRTRAASQSTITNVAHGSHAAGRHSAPSSSRGTYDRSSYMVKTERRRSRNRKAVFIGVVAAILIVAVGIGIFSYNKIVNDKLSLSGSNAGSALTSNEDSTVQYTLMKVDVGKNESVKDSYDTEKNTKFYLLMRTDTTNYSLSFILIPSNLSVTLSDNKNHPLFEAESVGGDAELISAVNTFAGVSINHFIGTNGEALAQVVGDMGGIQITLPCVLDDPYAGTQTLHAGDITLDKESALTVLRTVNLSGGDDTRSTILSSFTSAMLEKMMSASGFDQASVIEKFADTSDSDMQVSKITGFAGKMAGKELAIYSTSVPGSVSSSVDSGAEVFKARSSETASLLESFRNGSDPNEVSVQIQEFDKTQVHIEVRNGAGITGAATACKTFLEGQGYTVDKTGNTDDGTTYSETLIVYLGDDYENAANALVKSLGTGRVVNGGDYYTSDSNVIIIIGEDWSS